MLTRGPGTQHNSNTSPGPGGVQHTDSTDKRRLHRADAPGSGQSFTSLDHGWPEKFPGHRIAPGGEIPRATRRA